MSPYTEGQDALAIDILEVLNSRMSAAEQLARIRTMVEDCLPSPAPRPWTDDEGTPCLGDGVCTNPHCTRHGTAWERHDDPEQQS
jgi:hypothetical protein